MPCHCHCFLRPVQVREALDHLPSLLGLDDLDVLCPAEAAGADGAASASDPALVSWLAELLDHLAAPSPDWGRLPAAGQGAPTSSGSSGSSSCGGAAMRWPAAAAPDVGAALWPPLAVAATCRDAAALAAPLRAAGRLDHMVTLPAPTAESRAAILRAAAAVHGTQLEAAHLRLVAEQADGFDAADLEVLLDRAMHVAVRRQLAEGGAESSSGSAGGGAELQLAATRRGGGAAAQGGGPAAQPLLRLTREDLLGALEGFTPAAFWGTGSRKGVQAGVEGWADVGGMEEARQALHEALELPTKHARLVARVGGLLLLMGGAGCKQPAGGLGLVSTLCCASCACCILCTPPSDPSVL